MTGVSGKGKLTFEKDKADEMCREMNYDFPEIFHEAVLVEGIAENFQTENDQQNQNDNPATAPNVRPSGVRNENSDERKK